MRVRLRCPHLPSCWHLEPPDSCRAHWQLWSAAGVWRGLEVAVKAIVFSCDAAGEEANIIAKEAAIASNLAHRNVVATYSYDVLDVTQATGCELGICKFYLIQVCGSARHSSCMRPLVSICTLYLTCTRELFIHTCSCNMFMFM
jgi:hypothetical protein